MKSALVVQDRNHLDRGWLQGHRSGAVGEGVRFAAGSMVGDLRSVVVGCRREPASLAKRTALLAQVYPTSHS